MISLVISPQHNPDPDDVNYVNGFMAYEDANLYFNRANNFNGSFVFFRYAGYVSFTPDVLTYLFSFLPYLLQSFCYALTALLFGLWMFYQFVAILIDAGARPRLAFGVALAAAAYLHIVCQEFYLNLTFSIWPAVIGASIYGVRIALAGAKPHWFATILAAMSFASHPLAIASLPIIAAGLYLKRVRLTEYIPHAIVLVLGILFVVTLSEASRKAVGLHTILETLPRYFRNSLHSDTYEFVTTDLPLIIIILGGIVVGLARLPSLIRTGSAQATAILSGSLFIVVVCLNLFLASGRFTIDNISGRFFTPMIAFTFLALTVSFLCAPWLTALGQRLERFGRTPAHGLLAGWLVLSFAAGPAIFWKYYANRLQFLATAQCVRENSLPGIAIAAENNRYTLAIVKEGLGHFDRSSTELQIDNLKPSREPVAELQRVCPGIQSSFVQAVPNARFYIGPKAF